MAKVKFNEKAVETTIMVRLDKVLSATEVQNEIGETLLTRYRGFGKSGKPLNETRSFPELTKGTKQRRKRLSTVNQTDPAFRANKSAINFTGQLWAGLKFDIKDKGRKISLFFDGSRKPYQGLRGQPLEQDINNNKDLAKDLTGRGFVPLGKLDDDGKKRVTNIIKKFLRRALRF